ncbi:hypothetical protein [Microbacterium sp. 18062]|uniref:hypothetical protein n=1 Tax=Microbacterium sp. 18062 TaxID=2681410 RepID=UPI00135C3591|nr:hypothetical protein [Microbacterium sp. 18062]
MVALTLAIGGILLTIVPLLNLLAAPVLVAGFVCALIGLIGRRHGGKGLSIAALVTSAAGVLAVVLVVASVLFVGFGSLWDQSAPGTEPAPPAAEESAEHGAEHELVTVESAVGRTAFDETFWWYAVVIDNPNDDAIFEDVDVLVHAVDPDGVVLDTGWD